MSGLSDVIGITISGLNAAQAALQVSSENIANADNPKYLRQETKTSAMVIEGKGYGTIVENNVVAVDPFIVKQLQSITSTFGSSQTLDNYYDKINIALGDPNVESSSSLNSAVRSIYSSLATLTQEVTKIVSRQDFIKQLSLVSQNISNLADYLQKLRLQADSDIYAATNSLNLALKQLDSANTDAVNLANVGGNQSYFDMQKTSLLNTISNLVDINSIKRSDGRVNVATVSGISLLDDRVYQVSYLPVTDESTFTNNNYINPVVLNAVNNDGSLIKEGEIISGGTNSDITSVLRSGQLYALQQMRDIQIPQILSVLDNFASQLASTFNSIHNSGSSFVPASSYKSQNLFSATDQRNFSGTFRMGIIDPNGNSVNYAAENYQGNTISRVIKPLDINLSHLDNGNGPGKVTIQNILDEINQYFYLAPTVARVKLGEIEDIKLVSKQSSITPGGAFEFDFEFDNNGDQNHICEIMSVTVDNGAAGLTSGLPTAKTILPGSRQRNGDSNIISLAGGAGGKYNITARIKVTDANNNVHVSDIKYTINDNQTGMLNTRFDAVAASGDNTINGALGGIYLAPVTTQKIAQATLVNARGAPVQPGEKGYISIQSLNPSMYRIVLDGLDSKDNGNFPTSPATNKNLWHFLGMNNIFVENSTVQGSAINMKVRPDLATGSGYNNLSVGKLDLTIHGPQSVLSDAELSAAKGAIRLQGVPSNGDNITVNGVLFTFMSGGTASNQIDTSSGDIPTIIADMVNKFSANNAVNHNAGLDFVTYTINSSDRTILNMMYKSKGVAGNSFSISSNLSVLANLNSNPASKNISGVLEGGSTVNNSIVKKQLWNYSVGYNSNQSVRAFLQTQNTPISFAATGPISATIQTIQQYTTLFVGYVSNNASIVSNDFDQQQQLWQVFNQRFRATSGINIGQEMAGLIQFQAKHVALSKTLSLTDKLFSQLIDSL